MTIPKRRIILILFTMVAIFAFVWNRVRPITLAKAYSSHSYGGYIQIVEIPTSWLDGLLFRYNPFYRFEYYFPDGYLWSSASFQGESYNAKKAEIQWTSDNEAIVYLDGLPYYRLQRREWRKFNE